MQKTATTHQPPLYPEHEKLKALGGKNQTVGDFIQWLGEEGYELAKYDGSGERLIPLMLSRNDLLAMHFGIDTQQLEREKQAMLESLRAPAP